VEAIPILEELLRFDFKNRSDHDHLLTSAARWRVHIAMQMGDKTKALEIIRWVERGGCLKNLKTEFMKSHEALAASLQTELK
jgi:hypothetical protein